MFLQSLSVVASTTATFATTTGTVPMGCASVHSHTLDTTALATVSYLLHVVGTPVGLPPVGETVCVCMCVCAGPHRTAHTILLSTLVCPAVPSDDSVEVLSSWHSCCYGNLSLLNLHFCAMLDLCQCVLCLNVVLLCPQTTRPLLQSPPPLPQVVKPHAHA